MEVWAPDLFLALHQELNVYWQIVDCCSHGFDSLEAAQETTFVICHPSTK